LLIGRLLTNRRGEAVFRFSADRHRNRNRSDQSGVFKPTSIRRIHMGNLLHYAIVFLVVALIAAFFGFGGVAGTAMEGARLLFWVAIAFLVVTLVASFVRRA